MQRSTHQVEERTKQIGEVLKRLFLQWLVSIGLLVSVVVVAFGTPVPAHPPHTKQSVRVVALSTTTTTTEPAPTTTTTAPIAASIYQAWTRVADCEEGGWIGSSGSAYPDSLGITAQNWYAFGGGSDTSPEAQIAVAERFRAEYGMAIPDQGGCAAW